MCAIHLAAMVHTVQYNYTLTMQGQDVARPFSIMKRREGRRRKRREEH